MADVTNWIKNILYGYREIRVNGVPVIARAAINIVGLTVLDDPVNKWTNITFAGAYIPTDAPVPDTVMARNNSGGTTLTALSIYDMVPPLGEQTAYINGLTGLMYADNGFIFETNTITRAQPYKPIFSDAVYGFDGSGRIKTSVNTTSSAFFDLDIPDGATLTAVEVWILPAGSHVGLPVTKPVASLTKINIEDGNTDPLANETDQSANVSDYEDPHAITLDNGSTGPLAPTVIDNIAYFYRVKFTSEASTNALMGCTILGIKATYVTTTYRK